VRDRGPWPGSQLHRPARSVHAPRWLSTSSSVKWIGLVPASVPRLAYQQGSTNFAAKIDVDPLVCESQASTLQLHWEPGRVECAVWTEATTRTCWCHLTNSAWRSREGQNVRSPPPDRLERSTSKMPWNTCTGFARGCQSRLNLIGTCARKTNEFQAK